MYACYRVPQCKEEPEEVAVAVAVKRCCSAAVLRGCGGIPTANVGVVSPTPNPKKTWYAQTPDAPSRPIAHTSGHTSRVLRKALVPLPGSIRALQGRAPLPTPSSSTMGTARIDRAEHMVSADIVGGGSSASCCGCAWSCPWSGRRGK